MIALMKKTADSIIGSQTNIAMMSEISLRQRKYAQTKISLAREAMERLREKRLDDISVKELCETIPISEVTFYNYFPQKADLLGYLMMLWQLQMVWHLQNQKGKKKSNLEIIENLFASAAQAFEEFPFVMNEVLAFFLQQREDVCWGDMSVAEKLVAFPELIGIEKIQLPGKRFADSIFNTYIAMAIQAGELPQTVNAEELALMLDTILNGALMAFRENQTSKIKLMYRNMLKMLWKGLNSETHDG